MEKDNLTEIILGNKNVAKDGGIQINITQNNLGNHIDQLASVLRESCAGTPGATSREEPIEQPQASEKTRRTSADKRPKVAREVEDVFTYRWLNNDQGNTRIIRLYQYLTHSSVRWLDPDTSPDDWCALFMGKPKVFKLRWLGTQMHLKHLFWLLLEREYISRTNTSIGPWEIVGCHFVDANRRPFTNWNGQKKPVRKAQLISEIAEILNIATDIQPVSAS